MEIISSGDKLHEVSCYFYWEKSKKCYLLSDEFAQRVVMVKPFVTIFSGVFC